MKKLFILFFLAAIVLVGASCSQSRADKEDGENTEEGSAENSAGENGGTPAITFKTQEYNFNKIKEGEKVTHTFKFKNTGDAPLAIEDVITSCGCTVPEYSKEAIAPGKSGKVKAIFNSAGKSGQIRKTITVKSNAKEDVGLVLIGEVITETDLEGPVKRK